MWEQQVDAETRTRIRRIVKEAGNVPTLTELDQISAAATDSGQVIVEDQFFRFMDGNFAIIGQNFSEYAHHYGILDDGTRIHVAYRTGIASSSPDPLPTRLARISSYFIRAINQNPALMDPSQDWYLVPIPTDLVPLVIEGKGAGDFLVSGIDFVTHPGFIAMRESPADMLPTGLVRINSAYKKVQSPDAYVLSAHSDKQPGRWVSDYTYKSQSLESFRRAAAEFAGLYVFQKSDVVMQVQEITADFTIYNMAIAGPVEIEYPHVKLQPAQKVDPGYVISNKFEVVATPYGSTANIKKAVAEGWNDPISLNGILPVNGLTWDGHSQVVIDTVATDPASGTPHVRLQFDGPVGVQERFWEFSRLHEQQTQVFLYDELGSPSLPATVDLWDLLETFYGSQLILAISEDHGPKINTRLQRFLFEHHPKSCNLLFSIDLNAPYNLVYDDQGVPLLDEHGLYLPEDGYYCDEYILTLADNLLTIDDSYIGNVLDCVTP